MPVLRDERTVARNDVAVKLDAEIVRKAKHVAINRRITLAQYLSDLLQPLVERDFNAEMSKMLGQPKRGKKAGPDTGSASEKS